MDKVREACAEWLEGRNSNETNLDDLVMFVLAQRRIVRREMLEDLSRVMRLDPQTAAEAIQNVNDAIQREDP